MIQLPKQINKRCDRCNKLFCINNNDEKVNTHNIHAYPCPHCSYIDTELIEKIIEKNRIIFSFRNTEEKFEYNKREYKRRKWLELKRCVKCLTPFTIKKHYAFGKCKACHQKKLRQLKKSNTTPYC